MERLPNRIRERIDIEKIWQEELRKKIKDLYFNSEQYDEILHGKLEILINRIDELISLKNTDQDYTDNQTIKSEKEIEDFEFSDRFEEHKEIVSNLIVEIVSVVNMSNYKTEHIKTAPEEFKKEVDSILVPLDEFFESISYMKREKKIIKPPERLDNRNELNIKKSYEKEFGMNKKE